MAHGYDVVHAWPSFVKGPPDVPLWFLAYLKNDGFIAWSIPRIVATVTVTDHALLPTGQLRELPARAARACQTVVLGTQGTKSKKSCRAWSHQWFTVQCQMVPCTKLHADRQLSRLKNLTLFFFLFFFFFSFSFFFTPSSLKTILLTQTRTCFCWYSVNTVICKRASRCPRN